jgi:S-adenosylmethionine:tRNA ribosyltransferase-isomerase
MQQLKDKAIKVVYTVLHVGAGTFLPVKAAQIGDHLMHAEQIALKQTFVASIIDQLERGQPIVCVGTTALRNLESLFWVAHYYSKKGLLPDHLAQWYPYEHDQDFSLGKASKLQILKHFNDYLLQSKKDVVILLTSLIIVPGYPFMMVDGLITNFHQPGSTLLMLVAAFVGKDQWQTIYDYALTHNFRFLSYGDGSLLWREKN